jgi:periplasmic divalent cation tolerance protein
MVVLVTCPSRAVARRLATALVARQLAACVNIVPGVESVFRWQGKVDRAPETLLVIKAPAGVFGRLRQAIVKLHPYEVPEIIALPITAGHPAYLAWVASSVSP